MKIAAISDIHGNIYALMKAFEDIESQNVDLIVCLGDLVGYGPHPNEVIALIRRRDIPTIKGNYDASVVDGDFTFIRDNAINSFSRITFPFVSSINVLFESNFQISFVLIKL